MYIKQTQKMSGDNQISIAARPAADVVVVMVPFVAQGHLNQLLHLSRLVSAYIIPVHFVCTTHHIGQARSRHRSFDQLSDISTHIHFHEFPTPPYTTPPPHPTIPFPTHLQPSFDSTLHLRHPVADLIRSLSQKVKRVAVVHDVLMSYVVQDVKSIPNAETYVFQPPPAFYRAASHWEKTGGSFPVDLELMNRLPSQDGIFSPDFLKFVTLQRSHLNFHVGEVYDSSRMIEVKFIEYLEREDISGQTKIWAIGPFNPVLQIQSNVTVSGNLPMATWPMHSDQPRNAFLITEVFGIGVAVKEWDRRKELVTAVVVEDAVKTLMISKEGEEMRRRAEKLAGEVKRSVEKGGASRKELDSFISYITR
ncbi:hypothetical protein L2E82_30867 [Cichorium intybus]|uniref:Uncharacterized protein n=1 Tax=Cichorium intybus TaxID=13427 RepID=A0ACB9D1F1_CICIN|nr:hypothetical protein L2E82_30867 [Cichorium intybus]